MNDSWLDAVTSESDESLPLAIRLRLRWLVGEDRVDEGGDPTATDSSKKGVPSIDKGRDMVFPSVDRDRI